MKSKKNWALDLLKEHPDDSTMYHQAGIGAGIFFALIPCLTILLCCNRQPKLAIEFPTAPADIYPANAMTTYPVYRDTLLSPADLKTLGTLENQKPFIGFSDSTLRKWAARKAVLQFSSARSDTSLLRNYFRHLCEHDSIIVYDLHKGKYVSFHAGARGIWLHATGWGGGFIHGDLYLYVVTLTTIDTPLSLL